MKPVQIDPAGCGCTECLTGEYVPLDRATPKQVRKLLAGKLADATSEVFSVEGTYPHRRFVTALNSHLTWTWGD